MTSAVVHIYSDLVYFHPKYTPLFEFKKKKKKKPALYALGNKDLIIMWIILDWYLYLFSFWLQHAQFKKELIILTWNTNNISCIFLFRYLCFRHCLICLFIVILNASVYAHLPISLWFSHFTFLLSNKNVSPHNDKCSLHSCVTILFSFSYFKCST